MWAVKTLSLNSSKLDWLSWSSRSIQAQYALTSGLKAFGNLKVTSMTVMAESTMSTDEKEQIHSLWLKVITLVITSNFCYCQHHWANIDLNKKAGWLWVCSHISQSINKIPNAPSSEWWSNKGVDMPGHQAWNPESNCVLHVEYQIKVKKKYGRIEPNFHVQD